MTDTLAAAPAAPVPPPPPAGAADRARIATTGADLRGLVWRGQLLTIATLGIYRFWYRTDLRRWYWRNTIVGGDGFEYRGTPKELFVGFLIALAVTLPLYFAGALAALFLASEAAGNVVTMIGLSILAVLAQYGAYRSRRFRMTRTVWRGLRFDQQGSAWRYAFVSLGWFLLALATLGLLFPLFRRSTEAMKIRNTRFGTAQGRFDAPVGALVLRWLPCWLPMMLAALAAIQAFYVGVNAEDESVEQAVAMLRGLAFSSASIALFIVTWPLYRAAEFRVFTSGSAIGPVSFVSDLRASALYGVYLRFAVVVIGLGIAAAALIGLLFAGVFIAMRDGGARLDVGAPAIAGAALAYLGGIYVFMALKELMLSQAFWRRACASVTVAGLHAVDGVVATTTADESATGEGLADALDFGGV
jgi:uncharacterized membrane protein YjgN (DUF898 family)